MTAELYPTSIRTTAIGTCSLMARYIMGCLFFNRNKSIRLGAILAPQLALVLPNLTPGLPTLHLYIFSIVSLLGSILAILIPETANSSLPENFDQVLF